MSKFLFSVLLFFICFVAIEGKKRNIKDWNKVNENQMDKEWENGDDENELKHEFDRIKDMEKRKSREKSVG